jgi:hypothetical protein
MVVLTLALLISFLQYCFERNDLVRLLPIVLLTAATLLLLLVSPRAQRRNMFLAVARPSTVALIAIVSLPPLISSFYRTNGYAFEYGLVTVLTLVAVRILLTGIGWEALLLCFFWATTGGALIVVSMTFNDLLAAVGSVRYAPPLFDPNRISFFVVSAIPAQLWFAMRGRLNKIALLATIVCVWVLIAASSRGSSGALLIGGAATAMLYSLRWLRSSPLEIPRSRLFLALVLLCLLPVAVAAEQPTFEKLGNYLWTKLELGSRDRGMNSGLSGRTGNWANLLSTLPKTSWLWGNGYRTTESDFAFFVDNGYLAGIYEIGLFSTVIVVAKYALVFGFLWVAYVNGRSACSSCLLASAFILAIFLANAVVHRVLFGPGDPPSLLMLFLFVSTRQDFFAEPLR